MIIYKINEFKSQHLALKALILHHDNLILMLILKVFHMKGSLNQDLFLIQQIFILFRDLLIWIKIYNNIMHFKFLL